MDGGQREIFGVSAEAIALPSGFALATLQAMAEAVQRERARQGNEALAAREVAWGRHPALPAALITDAVDYVLARV